MINVLAEEEIPTILQKFLLVLKKKKSVNILIE